MRRSGEPSQYHDETPRRRVRRPHSQDLEGLHISDMKGRTQEMAENSPTSPFKAGPFVLPQSPSSIQNPVSPHRLYQHNPRNQSGVPPSPHGVYPHSAISPSRYQPGPPAYMTSVPSPSSGISTPSCATPTSASSIPGSPDFFGHGIGEAPAMSPSKSNPGYPIRSPSYFAPEHKPVFSDYQREQYTYPQGPSPGGTIHHHGFNRPVPSPTGYPNQPSPNSLPSRSIGAPSPSSGLPPPQSPVYRQMMNLEHLSGNPSGRKHNPVPVGKPADSPETARLRQLVIEYYNGEIETVKLNYYEKLQELFFLQNGGNIVDILIWKRKPNPQLTSFLNANKLEEGLIGLTPPSNVPLSGGQGGINVLQSEENIDQRTANEQPGNDPRSNLPNNNSAFQQFTEGFTPNVSPFTGNHLGMKGNQSMQALSRSLSLPNASVNTNTSGGGHSNPDGGQRNKTVHSNPSAHFHRSMSVGGPQLSNGPSNILSSGRVPSVKNPSVMSVLENSFGSHEEIAVEAKREAEVLKRIGELRKEGLWSAKRLPKVQEMSRKKAHWDYLLEEMQWLATDFAQERRWKRGVAKKLSRSVLKHHQELKSKEVKAEKEETVRLRRIASSIAREVKQFWTNVEKVVQYKVQSRLEEKRKKALDVQLNFIVDQTEKYSSWLAESLKNQPQSAEQSRASTVVTSPASSAKGEDEYDGSSESDVEETIVEEEELELKEQTDVDRKKELEMLKQDSELTLEELLGQLPPEMLEDREERRNSEGSGAEDESDSSGEGSNESNESDIEVDVESKDKEESNITEIQKPTSSKTVEKEDQKDGDFLVTEEMEEDDEQTLDEQENTEADLDHKKEIEELAKEGDMPIEELLKQYATGEDTTDFPSDEESSEESSEEEEAEAESGMEYLVKKDGSSDGADSDPDQELTSAAATAESLQPTGFTLETAHVQTKVPMLLRGTLREYQVIGLDWLVTMHGKCLNGILADEMGLGKTIQTIALLAHLACDKSLWGPHLVVVPTSVMLNWEMEFKKWLPGFKILTYYGSQKERKAKRQGWTKPNAFHVCITSYKLVIQDHQAFRRKKWKYLILDEAQNIKNFKSQRWQYLLNFNSQRRLLLTGTPLQNNLMELWSLMHFLMPHLFQSHKDFKEWFSNPLTGMIEGSREYNENLVKRLHKVLRPFLLRRLKLEVETQMPHKYEHVYRCRLSKRQRFLYDDFMSRTKTKETLESGHFLSVINILMQLRKVCNHPDLFEPRPTVSPLMLPNIVYYTSSLIMDAIGYDPFKHVNLGFLNLCLADIETTVTSYAAYRTQSLQTPRQLIVEIDKIPVTATPLVPASKPKRIPPMVYPSLSSAVGYDGTNSVHPGTVAYPSNQHFQDHRAFPPYGAMMWHQDGTPYGPRPVLNPALAMQQPRLTSTPPSHSYSTRHSLGEMGRTQGQYSIGLAKPMPPPPPYPGHLPVMDASSWSNIPTPPLDPSGFGSSGSVQPGMPVVSPVMRHAPQGVSHGRLLDAGHPDPVPIQVSPTKKLAVEKKQVTVESVPKEKKSSPFYLSFLSEKQAQQRKEKLSRLALANSFHCKKQPVYGLDLVKAVTVVKKLGQDNNYYHSDAIEEIIMTPEQRIAEMNEKIKRFVFHIPPAASPGVVLHCSHPSPHQSNKQRYLEEVLTSELKPKFDLLHTVSRGMRVQFPEARLIQYDCGKLQTLDILLRELKLGKHRVLIFTQMTKMLDVLEKFLNYHGYVYLRLDGSTRVEQRQLLMDRFNADPRIFCFILSTRSGGLGVNLTGADTVIFYDSDWNPTMDAQAQDRCHRIGQTRDVNIYRLISERTVEENILKKANQKRLLGDIAIEGGNFTTAFFKEASLKELFAIDSAGGFEAALTETANAREIAKKRATKEEMKETKHTEEKQASSKPEAAGEKVSQNLLEQALLGAEDEQDACAATKAKAEEAAELAEFDEGIPYCDEASKERDEETSRVEEELMALENQLTPVERYAVRFYESSGAYVTLEQIEEQEQVETAKKDWEMDHILALKEEEEKRAAEDEDEILFTYAREDATQVKKSKSKSKAKSKTPRPDSRNSSRSSSSKKSSTKKGENKSDKESSCAGPQEDKSEVLRESRPPKRFASRTSSRSSSCSSSGRVTRQRKAKLLDD